MREKYAELGVAIKVQKKPTKLAMVKNLLLLKIDNYQK